MSYMYLAFLKDILLFPYFEFFSLLVYFVFNKLETSLNLKSIYRYRDREIDIVIDIDGYRKGEIQR